jgi:hypothetical protein
MMTGPGHRVARAADALLAGAIDYAGLFPPAALDMAGAVSEYASYVRSDDRWALGRCVVAASRLEELRRAHDALQADREPNERTPAWRVSAVFGADVAADLDRVAAFNRSADDDESSAAAPRVDAVEVRATSLPEIDVIAATIPAEYERFIEIPVVGDVVPLVRAIGRAGAYAKIRTGGTAADAFPGSEDVARFLAACVSEGVPFKATAGLHHAVRGEYPLTYAPDSAHGTMFGFLNIFLAAAFLRAGEDEAFAHAVLEERNAGAFRFDDRGATYEGRRLSNEDLVRSREAAIRSFGSCSFREPVDELETIGVL